jgi:hypothetical protein
MRMAKILTTVYILVFFAGSALSADSAFEMEKKVKCGEG